jgi:cytochrome c oxidase cbb3-type subunit 1
MTEEAKMPQRPNLSTPQDILDRAAIDRTTRLPVLFFYTSAGVWLLVATLLGFISSMKSAIPGFLTSCEWFNYGRSQPAFINALVYGWAMQAGFGTMIWAMARLCRSELKNPLTVIVAGHFWNLGVTIGVIGILAGEQGSGRLLEFPAITWPILLVAYVLITIWMVVMFAARKEGHVYISQWYILAACFTFPWIYLTANLIINTFGATGVSGPATAHWFASSMIFLWLVPVGLAASYFIIPKVVGKPIHSYSLAKLAFWSLMVLGGWTGLQEMAGGPFNAWIPGISGGAQFLLLIPVLAVGINHYRTVQGSHHLIEVSPALRFTFFGSVGYAIASVAIALLGTYTLGRYAQFSYAQDGAQLAAVYMFFTMTMFGAMYFIVPRVTGCEWLSGSRIRFHFWFNAYGSIALVVLLLAGGMFMGSSIDSYDRTHQSAIEFGRGFRIGTGIGWLLILVANVSFLHHMALMVLNRGRRAGQPTYIHEPPVDHAELVVTHEGAETA